MRCSKCGYENQSTNRFCAGCGAPLPVVIQNEAQQPPLQNLNQYPQQNFNQPPQQGYPGQNFPQGNFPNPQKPNDGKKIAIIIGSVVGGIILLIILASVISVLINPHPHIDYDKDDTTTTTESTTEFSDDGFDSGTITIAQAYLNVIDSYLDSKGGYTETEKYPQGVVYVDHIDFDGDATEELFILYNESTVGTALFYYDIWTYSDGSVMKVCNKKFLCSIAYDNVVTITFVKEFSTGRTYLHQDFKDSDGVYTSGAWYTKKGNEFVWSNKAWFASNYADVGEESYTYSQFDKYWETFNVKIGKGESSANTLTDQIEEIGDMK